MTRKELVTSREWWVGYISQRLWEIHGSFEEEVEDWEFAAERVVDEKFMEYISEINALN